VHNFPFLAADERRQEVAPARQRAAAAKATAASLRARGHARSPEIGRQKATTAVGAAFDA